MASTKMSPVRAGAVLCKVVALSVMYAGGALAATIEVFHADSLASPMRELKKAFEASHQGVTVNLTSGVSRQLADQILRGDACDVFAPSSPAVADELLNNKVAGSNQ